MLDLPYDRVNTAMERFPLCDDCRMEDEEMADRRFHAEAMACPGCGPHVTLRDSQGHGVAEKEEGLQGACDVVRQGGIRAVKGLGGFQLWVDASSELVVERLRLRKHRPRNPFAVLFPSLEAVRAHGRLSDEEEILRASSEAPVVLLRKNDDTSLVPAVAPNNLHIGSMLPSTP